MIARNKPERFSRLIVVYQEDLPNGDFATRYVTSGGKTLDILGLLELGKLELLRWVHNF
jgi:hypothetical protein